MVARVVALVGQPGHEHPSERMGDRDIAQGKHLLVLVVLVLVDIGRRGSQLLEMVRGRDRDGDREN